MTAQCSLAFASVTSQVPHLDLGVVATAGQTVATRPEHFERVGRACVAEQSVLALAALHIPHAYRCVTGGARFKINLMKSIFFWKFFVVEKKFLPSLNDPTKKASANMESLWARSVRSHSPLVTFQMRTVESYEPLATRTCDRLSIAVIEPVWP